ncbi:MAG TPA: methyltransferase domain-containing protein [Reyranella sp.]|nr:methyltransferase domain-containing protein [Reyranella sp.]
MTVGKAGEDIISKSGGGNARASVERAEYERMHAVEDRMWWFRGLRTLVAQMLVRTLSGLSVEGTVLDAGCGTGGMLGLLGASVAGRSTMGLEFDSIAASLAAGKSRRPVAVGSVHEMPLRAGALAAYVSLDVFCHGNVDPQRALGEAHRCLAPGAILVLNLPAYQWLLSAHDKRVHNVRRFRRGQVRILLADHGFRVVRSSYWNTLLFPLMLLHRLTERVDAESDVRDFPGWIDALFAMALAIERALIGFGISLPFGGSLLVVAARNG